MPEFNYNGYIVKSDTELSEEMKALIRERADAAEKKFSRYLELVMLGSSAEEALKRVLNGDH